MEFDDRLISSQLLAPIIPDVNSPALRLFRRVQVNCRGGSVNIGTVVLQSTLNMCLTFNSAKRVNLYFCNRFQLLHKGWYAFFDADGDGDRPKPTRIIYEKTGQIAWENRIFYDTVKYTSGTDCSTADLCHHTILFDRN